MELTINVNVQVSSPIDRACAEILEKLGLILKGQEDMASQLQTEIDDLRAAVEENTSIDLSVVQALQGFQTLLEAAVEAARAKGASDAQLADLHELASTVRANNAKLTAAIVANTGAGTPVDAPPVDVPPAPPSGPPA